MIAINILLGFAAAFLWMALLVERDTGKQKNFTLAFAAVLAFTFAMNLIA